LCIANTLLGPTLLSGDPVRSQYNAKSIGDDSSWIGIERQSYNMFGARFGIFFNSLIYVDG
jgi:hypothetical protein